MSGPSAVAPRSSAPILYAQADTTPRMRMAADVSAPVATTSVIATCSTEATTPESHTARRVVQHILRPLPFYAATAAAITGAIFIAALPGMGLLVGLLIALALIFAALAAMKHVEVEQDHSASQATEETNRRTRCIQDQNEEILRRLPAQPASPDTVPTTSPVVALAPTRTRRLA